MSERSSRSILEALPPATLLATDNRRLIRGGVACMHDVETVREYVGYENQHQRRRWVLRMLADRAATLRESAPEDDSSESQTHGLY
ncbi:hypothetical protein DU500_17380 (plasmid) [Haloplanus rubicundus]|uniref:DUF8129 domain-containing protein n=1 Tax=Haloplanus rubicundus TaxID=1547898 RepID=A0A345E7U1_9EURY|nr:hypothetical protein [Haloplanus rubicundus]AXG08263.1 hypothetical protein DU500_17380 [Haloplanus rubicundus]